MQRIQQRLVIVLLASVWAGLVPASAQFTSDFQTNFISGVTNYWPGNYVVGSNNFCDALLIRSGGLLANADGFAGYLSGSVSNSVLVADANSTWSNANLYLGYSGGGNSLTISNGGWVTASLGAYVANDASSSGNLILVTGNNSVWSCANDLLLGYSGSGNSMVISNGGHVINNTGFVGDMATSSSNSVLVTGSGSVWSNNASCQIGSHGGNNRMTINKGGRVRSNYAILGYANTANNNSVLVSDSGSVWDDSAEASVMTFGMDGSNNSLIVTNGGQLLGYYAYFGRNLGAGYNSALVTGSNSLFTVNCYIYTGNQGHDTTFTAANGAAVVDKFCYISYADGAVNNSVLVTGTNTTWQNTYSVFVGFDGDAGSLTISNGASMTTSGAFGTTHDGALGVDSTSSSNRALVTGAGSILNIADNMYVGLDGPANTMVISNGGKVVCTSGYLGSNPGSDFNSALVTGANSVWTNATNFYVGHMTVGNSLVISNGGRVVDGTGFVGRNTESVSNSVIITGAGSVWSNSTYVYVGCLGGGNSLVVSNGGRLSDDRCLIGYDDNSSNNFVLVTGTGSVLNNPTVTYVGDFGQNNSLVISNGGLVTNYWGLIGEEDSSSNNTVYVETGGVWRNNQLAVGDLGSHNTLFVNGGTVYATTELDVGYDPLYPDNLVMVNSGAVIVTNAAHNAVLEVYGGKLVLAGGTLRVDTLIVTNASAQFMKTGGTLIYQSLQLTPAYDADGDGIPNGWEQARGLDPLNPNDAQADPDHDGKNNWEEYMAGTNPTNAASRLAITSMTVSNSDVRVSWLAVGGKSYVLQTNSGFNTSFADVGPAMVVPGSGETNASYVNWGAATNGPAKFYRVRLGP